MSLLMDFSISHILQFPPFPLLLTSILFFFILIRYFQKSRGQGKVPPGPKPLPIVGNLHQLKGGLPHHVLTRLCQKYGPVMKLQLGQISAVVISSPEAAKEVLKTHDISFADRPRVYGTEIVAYDHSSFLLAPYAEYWRQVRKIAMIELFSTQRVLSFRSIREEEVWNLVQFICSSQEQTINLTDKIFSMTNHLISRAAFGSKNENQKDFFIALKELTDVCASFQIADLYPSLAFLNSVTGAKGKLLRVHRKMDKILEDIVTKHKMKRNAPAIGDDETDIVDTLLKHAEVDSGNDFHITINQIKAILLDLFTAGSGTSSVTIDWVMAELLKNPRVMKKAQEEVREACKGRSKIEEADIQSLQYLNLVIKEALRLHPSFALVTRLARKTCEINGYTVPANSRVLINAYALGRDPTIWTNPECFQPERFEGSSIDIKGNNFELLPFGSGRRMCPGIAYAMTIIELAVSQLLYHFDWKLAGGIKLEDLDMTETFESVAKKKSNLNVIATTRIPFQK